MPPRAPLLLIERLANGHLRFIVLAETPHIVAEAGARYALIDKASGKSPQDLRVLRKGDMLVITQDDDKGALVSIEGFFQEPGVTFVPQATLDLDAGTLSGAGLDASSPVIDTTAAGEPVLWQGGDNDTWSAGAWGWIGGGVAAAGLIAVAANGGGSSDDDDAPPPAPVNNTVAGTIVGGPVVASNDLRVEIYAADGVTKLGEAQVNADGSFSVEVGDYFGVVIARVINTGSSADYLDEATETDKDLNAQLFAMDVVTEPNSTVIVNLNALTTVAYQKAVEAAAGGVPTPAQVDSANAAIAAAFGIDSLHHTVVVTTNGGSYIADDGLSAGERYGAVLAALSGADAVNGGSSQQTIDSLVAGITITGGVATLNTAAQTVVVHGAERTSTVTGVDLTQGVVVVVDTTAPVFTSGTVAAAINENSGGNQAVYTAAATDVGTVIYSLKAGGDSALFGINGSTGGVTLLGNPDYETKAGYSVTVVATDSAGNRSERAVTLAINNLDEVAPTITSGAVATAINENSGAGQVIYTVTSTDSGDISGGVTYSLKTGGDAALFSINGSTGAVTLIGNPDYETKSTYNFTVVATDAANHSVERDVSLAINDVDEVAPTIGSVSVPASGTYVAGQTLSFTVNTSESVTVVTAGGTPRLALTIGSTTVYANYASGSGTSALVFNYTLQPGDLDTNGITVDALSANGGSLRDVDGNNLDATLNGVGVTSGVLVEATVPAVASVSVPANDIYVAGETLSFTVNTSENVIVTTTGGTPRLALVIGSTTVYANYASGSGSSALVFNYTVQANNVDADGITVGALATNGGSIADTAGNNLNLALNSVGSTTGVQVDAVIPTISSVGVPVNHTYVAGEALNFTVNTSENISVVTSGGTPRLALTIGSTTVYANYISGSGSSALLFRYTVQSGEVDADGITVGTLDTHGGSLRDGAGNDLTTTLNGVGSTAGVLVQALAPTVSSVGVPANHTYIVGEVLSFTVNTSENVTVNTTGGTPQLALTIGSTTVYANYVSGSGTSALLFSYTVQAGEADSNGIAVDALSANGGTITDAAGNSLNTILNSIGSTSGVLVDAVAPTVSSVSVPANDAYIVGETLSFTVNTSENVTVVTTGGTPRLALDIGGATAYANYVSGSGTSALVFSYTVLAGDNDADGITVSALANNGGSLRDAAGNNLNLTLNSVGNTAGVLVDTTAPVVGSVSVPANDTYAAGETLSFIVNTSETVFVSTSGGTPRLALVIGGTTVYATYSGGSGTSALAFSYTLQAGQVDNDGVAVGVLSANGGSLRDAGGNDLTTTLNSIGNTAGVLVDATVPTVSSVSVPSNRTYLAGETLSFTVNTNENVIVNTASGTPQLVLVIGNSAAYANYVSGSGSSALVFSYTVQAGDADTNGIEVNSLSANGGSLSDAAGNTLNTTLNSIGITTGVLIDAQSPTVSSVGVPSGRTYSTGETLSFTVHTTENVTVVTTGGTPRLELTIGSSTVYANYASGTGTSSLVFSYTVQAGDTDTNGIAVVALSANNGTLRDAAGNNLNPALNSVGGTTSVLIDTSAPSITSVDVPANGTYRAGQDLYFTIHTSEAVIVDTNSNSTIPHLALTIGGSTVYANYDVGSGTSALRFLYVVQSGQVDSDGIAVGALTFNGGSIIDLGGNVLNTTLNSVATTAGVLVDAVVPTVTSVSVPANHTYVAGDVLSFTVNTSENVTVNTTGGTPQLALVIGSTTVYANFVSGSGTSALLFQYTVLANQLDTNGISVSAGALSANGGTLRDSGGNTLTTTLNSIGSMTGVLVDAVVPTVTSVSVPASSTYNTGDTLSFTVNTSENVTVVTTSGTPQLALTIGSTTVYADFVSGSGTNALLFQYTVLANQLDTDGIGIATGALSANGGTLRDAAGNNLTTTLNSIGTTTGVLVDGVAPTLSSHSPTDDATGVAAGSNIVLTFSENVQLGSGNIVISNGSGDVRTINVASHGGQISIVGNVVTINPTTDLLGGSSYHVQIGSSAITDTAGNTYAGIGDTTTLNFTTAVNTNIVVFDFVEGVSSSHSGRTFDAGTSYTIYIRVDSGSGVLNVDGSAGASWGMWSGGNDLGADDRIVLVGNGAPVVGSQGGQVTRANKTGAVAFWSAGWYAGLMTSAGGFIRMHSNTGSNSVRQTLWNDGNWASTPEGGGTVNFTNNYRTDMPAGILTSQGLA